MDSIKLLKSDRLFLVHCQIADGLVKAGWGFSLGALSPVETLEGHTEPVRVQVPDFLQQANSGGELFHPNDTVDFVINE